MTRALSETEAALLTALELARTYVANDLQCTLEAVCDLNPNTLEPLRETLSDEDRPSIEGIERDLAVIDAAIAAAKAEAGA
ncbi:hypothetical protein [Oceanibaculum indicum]|uniref:Uncharacterized protein n=1 Tax=Oceanibaculum indicum P24 TaxID=1207063 RepID=K2JSJ8_9PROT|nr:hypothetical protein [Oceanibaculum indicum]EKE78458.1 hypothetical protein P24_02821 [Oceanibaculum indicum P24]